MPPLIQRNPQYLTISTVLFSGCPRSGKVESTPMLLRKSAVGMAVVAARADRASPARAGRANPCPDNEPESAARAGQALTGSMHDDDLSSVPFRTRDDCGYSTKHREGFAGSYRTVTVSPGMYFPLKSCFVVYKTPFAA